MIGSGAGGGTLPHALAPTGKRILLLERGGYLPREVENWDSRAVWLDKRYANAGTWLDTGTGKAFTPKQLYATERYTADVVVVAGGAINSAALLLRSANDRHPHGLGNASGVVGRHLMLHNNSSSDDVLIGFDAPEADDPADLARHALDFWLTTEDLPLPDNRVTLGADGQINLTYTPTNLQAHARLKARFQSLLDAIQCSDQVLENYSYRGGRLGIAGVAHQNGTIRFGPDPTSSALDLDCKLHELDNVYIADSSFFVSSTAVNPTLTIIANALRVAETVAGRLGASTLAEPAVQPRMPRQSLPILLTTSGAGVPA